MIFTIHHRICSAIPRVAGLVCLFACHPAVHAAGILDDELISEAPVVAEKLTPVVKDLKYGEVLFNFYQQKYFASAVQLQVAQLQGRLPGNAAEAELLLGGLYLSYGLHTEAEEIFNRLIAPATEEKTRNRAWFYLAKIRYQKGFVSDAEAALAKVSGDLGDDEMEEEFRSLQANVLMALGKYTEAAEVLKQSQKQRKLATFASYNLGVALMAAGQPEQGIPLLEGVGKSAFAEPELRALSDKAYLALGYSHIKRDAARARDYLQQVRLNGPFSDKALLGLGWTDYVQERYEDALRPWLELSDRPRVDAAGYEALIGISSAFERLEANQQAADAYQNSIDTYQRALEDLDGIIGAVQEGKLWELLLGQVSQGDMGWFWEAELSPTAPETRYLADLIASHEFHEGIKNLRDLRYLITLLDRWTLEMPAYQYMLQLRRSTYETNIPKLAAQQVTQRVGELQERRDRYAEILERMQRQDHFADRYKSIERTDLRELATPKEREQLERLVAIKERLEALQGQPGLDAYRERYQRLSGLVQWDIGTDFKPRFWALKAQLNEVDRLLTEALEKQLLLERTAVEAPRGFEGYDQRIAEIQQRIDTNIERVAAVFGEQQKVLEAAAMQTLARLRQHLVDYRDQAQFSLARLKDRVAARTEVSP